MFCGSYFWIIFPLIFFGMMILCMIFSRRRGRWSCFSPFDSRYYYRERIKKLEDEIERLKNK
jgi:hypothetical protein